VEKVIVATALPAPKSKKPGKPAKAARTNLNRNVWDYLIGGAETETTLARNLL
jgi:hypothetical protein